MDPRNPMLSRLVVSGLWLSVLAITGCQDSGTGPGPDPVPDPKGTPLNPLSGFVTVAPGVRLQYLDFGGTGEPLLLLAGLNNTANVYRSFAPLLTGNFRVRAVTRRGYGASSQPTGGYDPRTLARDILALLDSWGVSRVHLVGHSIAGQEMNRFAADYPSRVGRMVYLDAAWDNTQPVAGSGRPPGWFWPLGEEPAWTLAPAPTEADRSSRAAWGAWIARVFGLAYPPEEIAAQTVVNGSGAVVGYTSYPPAGAAILAAVEAPPYAAVLAPSLGIYGLWNSPADFAPWLTPGTADWLAAEAIFPQLLLFSAAQRQKFDLEVVNSTVLTIGTTHYFWLAHLSETASATISFLGSP